MATRFRDRLYRQTREQVKPFEFDEEVTQVFDDMIRRSVPGYETVICVAAAFVADAWAGRGVLYDLGCSIGTGSAAVLELIDEPRPRMLLVDSSQPMIDRCRDRFSSIETLRCVCDDLCVVDFEPSFAMMMNYTLQFIDPELRNQLLARIRGAMLPGGLLILSEKVCLEPENQDALAVKRHEAFKRLMRYSDTEIAQKRRALEQVLIPDTLESIRGRLRDAGFVRIEVWFRCLNWVSIAAYADD